MNKGSSKRNSTSPVPLDGTGAKAVVSRGYDKVITAVRVRPLNSNDDPRATDIIRYFGDQKKGLSIVDPTNIDSKNTDSGSGAERNFQFDHTFWSVDATKKDYYSGQEDVFDCIGIPIVNTCLKGVNCSLFAYGQVTECCAVDIPCSLLLSCVLDWLWEDIYYDGWFSNF